MIHRRAKRRDANERGIIDALEMVGATVIQLDVIDLLVGYRGKNYLLEVTNPENAKHTKERERKVRQAEWREAWSGHAVEVLTVSEALDAIGATREV